MFDHLFLLRIFVLLLISFLVACGGDVTSSDSNVASNDGAPSNDTPTSQTPDNTGPPGSPVVPDDEVLSESARQGKLLYESATQGCLSCHGADGQATIFKVIDLTVDTYGHSSVPGISYSLEEYIELWMPVGTPSLCTGNCARDIAAFIRSLSVPTNTPVQVPPVADATASQNLQGFAPLIVSFNGSRSTDADGTLVAYEWDFGDGQQSAGIEQSYQYDAPGTYQVELVVRDNDGNTDADNLTVVVQENAAPVAVITSSAVTGLAPLTIQFDAGNSSDDQGIVNYQWTILGVSTNGDATTYTFNEPGTYDVQLQVEDGAGLLGTTTQTITVASPDNNIAPVANAANSTNLSGPSPLSVNFDASASADDRNQIARYMWDFGGGQVVEGITVTREFTAVGDYTVRLTVEDVQGLRSQVELVVSVINQTPQAVIDPPGSTIALAPYRVDFSSANSSDDFGITRREWYLDGDNIVDSTELEPSFTYQQAGGYNVRLTVFDEQGASDTADLSIQVLDADVFAADRYSENCSFCHGANGEGGQGPTLIKEWTLAELTPNVQNMMGLYGNCQGINQSDCVDAMTTYIIDQFSRIPEEPPINACLNTDVHLISSPVKALTQGEFYNTIEDVFSITFTDDEKLQFNLPLDSSATRYSTDSSLRVLRGLSADPNAIDDLYPALSAIVTRLSDELTSVALPLNQYGLGNCSFGNESCRTAYRSAILSKAFRRNVVETDAAFENAVLAYNIFINDGLSESDAFIHSIVSYTLFSPEFIFHSYRGELADNGYRLTNQELAQKIAYLVWGAPADSALLSLDWHRLLAGENDSLLDAELVRLFSDPRAKHFVDTFLQQWLRLETDVAQQLSFTSDNNRAVEFANAVKSESEHFIRYLITQNESINSVINANYTFMNSSLADFYGVNIPGLSNDFSRVELDAVEALNNRQGLLTQARFLTTGSKSDRPGSVHRGVTVLKELMCHTIGPPSGEAPDIGDVDRTMHTESALFRMVTETPGSACEGCHQTINPVSFPFEAFDRFGRHPWALRNQQGSLPEYAVYETIGVEGNPDANGPVQKVDTFYLNERQGFIDFDTHHGHRITGGFNDHQGLINLLGEGPAFGECLNDNLYDYIIGTNAERGLNASSSGNETQHLSQTCSKQLAIDGVSGIRTLIANLIKRPEFRTIRRD
ncbi:MAG: PKD domain-containing protein [Cellvibrionaceae bacterium]